MHLKGEVRSRKNDWR